jgi:Formamidopyrimidine-DNA glycosylase H2TH domain
LRKLWVAARQWADEYRDELLFQARVHPESYSNSLSEEDVGRLHDALMHVCHTAVDTLAIADDFPENCLCLPALSM